jgi:hypothetical protein
MRTLSQNDPRTRLIPLLMRLAPDLAEKRVSCAICAVCRLT